MDLLMPDSRTYAKAWRDVTIELIARFTGRRGTRRVERDPVTGPDCAACCGALSPSGPSGA